jgi:glyoxylase-like metal-dependent hydrolase (beta-lactamase superfamily II)
MFDFIRAGERTYYIENPARVGVYLADDGAWLIDGGYSSTAAELILGILSDKGIKLRGIIVTHAHPDHSGGCRYLQEKTGCGVYAYGLELAPTRHSVLHPSISWGGFPPHSLRGRGMMAEQCIVREMTGIPSGTDIPSGLEIIPLPGHSFDMIGIRTSDDVVFPADSICSETILKRYGITFLYDTGAYIRTLETIADMKAKLFVPSHVTPLADIRKLALLNKANVLAAAENIVRWCSMPVTFEKLLQKVFTEYNRVMNFEEYCLVGSTVRSYLSWLKDSGRLETTFKNNEMLWCRTEIS